MNTFILRIFHADSNHDKYIAFNTDKLNDEFEARCLFRKIVNSKYNIDITKVIPSDIACEQIMSFANALKYAAEIKLVKTTTKEVIMFDETICKMFQFTIDKRTIGMKMCEKYMFVVPYVARLAQWCSCFDSLSDVRRIMKEGQLSKIYVTFDNIEPTIKQTDKGTVVVSNITETEEI